MIRTIATRILREINKKVNPVNWENLRSINPISEVFGYDRGPQSIHRYYIDEFIRKNANKIKGHVLEVGDSMYMSRYNDEIASSTVIHYKEVKGPNGFIGDLTNKQTLPQSKFDCFICTQTFNFIYDFQAAIEGASFLLKDGGHLLATVSGIQQISKFDQERWGDFWRFTEGTCEKAFGNVFGENLEIVTYGNVLSSIAALEGLASSELTKDELDLADKSYPLIIGIVARKSDKEGASSRQPV